MFSPGGLIIPSGFYIKKALKHIIPFRLLSPCGIIFQGHDFDGNFRPVVGTHPPNHGLYVNRRLMSMDIWLKVASLA